MHPNWYAYGTHCQVCGTSQSGKSKFCENCIRAHIRRGNGVCLIDWHGTLYRSMLNYLAYTPPDRPLVRIDPSGSHDIPPFNPFPLPEGREPSSHVNRLASVLVKPWGQQNTNEMPNYDWDVKMLLGFMGRAGRRDPPRGDA